MFGKHADDALTVFTCESGLNPNSVGDSTLPSTLAYKANNLPYGESIGIAQIRLIPGRPSREKLLDPYFNISYAKQIFDLQGWKPWSCARKYNIK